MRGERIDDVFQRPIAEVLEISRKVDPVLSEEEAGSGPSRDESESMKRRRYNLLHFLGGPEANKIGYVTDPQNFLRFEELLGAAQEYLENKLEVRGVTAYVEVRTTLAMIYANRKASHRPKPDPLVELSTVLRGTYEARPNLEPFEVEVFWLL